MFVRFLFYKVVRVLEGLSLGNCVLVATSKEILRKGGTFSSRTSLKAKLRAFPSLASGVSMGNKGNNFATRGDNYMEGEGNNVGVQSLSFVTEAYSCNGLRGGIAELATTNSKRTFSFRASALTNVGAYQGVGLGYLQYAKTSIQAKRESPFVYAGDYLVGNGISTNLRVETFLQGVLLVRSTRTITAIGTASTGSAIGTTAIANRVLVYTVTTRATTFTIVTIRRVSRSVAGGVIRVFAIGVGFLVTTVTTALRSTRSANAYTNSEVDSYFGYNVAGLVVRFFLL